MLVSSLDENLLSVGQMLQHGYFFSFEEDKVGIFKERKLESHFVIVQMIGNICLFLI